MSGTANLPLGLAGLNRLPAMPQVLTKLLEALQDDVSDVSKLARLIEMDAALSARLLAAANSPAYRRSTQINSIRDGIMAMGWDMVKTLALSAAMHQILHEFSGRERYDLRHYWHHSISTALLSKRFAARFHDVPPDEAYLTGLLHDIGQLALLVTFPQRYGMLYEQAEDDRSLLLAEHQEFGTDHCRIGTWLVDDWEIRSFLQDAIAFHHDSADNLCNATALVKTIHFANALSIDQQSFSPQCLNLARDWFNLDARELSLILVDNDKQVRAIALSLGIDIDKPAKHQGVSHLSLERTQRPALPEANPDKALADAMAKTALLEHVTRTINSRGSDQAEFHTTLQQIAWLLCGARQVLIFEVDQGSLLGRAMTPQQKWVESFAFRLDQDYGVIASALAWGCHTHSFEHTDRIRIDKAESQLIRACASDGILCLPMLIAEKQYGVMVLAMNATEAMPHVNDAALAQSLAAIAASCLNSRSDPQTERHENSMGMTSQPDLRKFVHETSNPLSTIKNYLGVLHRKLAGKGVDAEELRIVNEEIDRVGLLISHLADTPTETLSHPVSFDINQAVKDLIQLHQETHLRPAGIGVRLQLDAKLPRIFSQPHKLRQILANLLRNAAEAMPDGGELTISTCSESIAGGGESVVIQVSDTGPGIDEDLRGKLFRPVQSTKGNGHGGIGLSIVAETVSSLGGDIRCRSAIGSGTTFEIRLPHNSEMMAGDGPHWPQTQTRNSTRPI